MPFGISLLNNSGQEIFKGVEKSIVLMDKGTITATGIGNEIITSYSGDAPPLLFINFPTLPNSCAGITTRNPDGKWVITLSRSGTTPYAVNWYLFAAIPNATLSGYGIAIYNDNGELAYQSNYKPLQVIHGGLVSSTGDTVNISSNRPSKMAHFVPPLRLSSFSGSQQTGGYTVNVNYMSRTNTTLSLIESFYVSGIPSPGVIYAQFGYWESMFITTIDASMYD